MDFVERARILAAETVRSANGGSSRITPPASLPLPSAPASSPPAVPAREAVAPSVSAEDGANGGQPQDPIAKEKRPAAGSEDAAMAGRGPSRDRSQSSFLGHMWMPRTCNTCLLGQATHDWQPRCAGDAS